MGGADLEGASPETKGAESGSGSESRSANDDVDERRSMRRAMKWWSDGDGGRLGPSRQEGQGPILGEQA